MSGRTGAQNRRDAVHALRRSLGLLRPHTGGQRALAGAGLAALVGEVVMRLLEPWPVKVVVDAVVPAAAGGTAAPGTGMLLVAAAVAVLVVAGLRAVCSYLSTVCFALVGSRVTTRLRARVYDHLLCQSPTAPLARSGDMVNRLVGDVGRLQEVAVTAGLPLVGNVLTFTGMLVVMLVLDPLLALAVVAVLPLFLLLGGHSGGRITEASRAQRRREGDMAGDAGEALGALRVVQAYGLEGRLADRFASANEKSLSTGVKARRLAAGLERRTDVLVGVATAVVLGYGAQRVLAGSLTPGELVVFLTYLKSAFKPMRDLAKHTGRISRATASGERVADLLDQEPGVRDRSWARPISQVRGDLRLESVTVAHRDGRPVLTGADLHVRPGERVGVVGASGAGKSTLLSLLVRFVEPRSGTVRLDGHSLDDLTLASLRSSVALVLQESVLFADTVRENVRFGRPAASDREVEEAVRLAGAEDFVLALPQGYETVLGERGASLSGGQRQRIAVARAILRDAAVVLLDEPTTGLDEASAREVLHGLRRLTDGRTTLVVSHDHRLLQDCDRLVEVAGGRVRPLLREVAG
ncbi:MAG TPA: ABC transporter ATP-binding protein [Jiangellales bacterium]|nr:ABC transporter ATP-binding protein [Jiangellales bacterium]